MRTRMEREIQKKHHKTADIKEDKIMSFEQVSKDLGKVIEYIHADKLDDADKKLMTEQTLDYFDIDIIHKELRGKTVESRLVIDFYGKATIFIQPDLDENYEQFLKAHELGHYLLHYKCDVSFNYLTRVYKTKIEKEANSFACKLLMSDINIKHEENMDFIAMEKGIPLKVWHSVMNLI